MPSLSQLQKLPGKGDGGWKKQKCLCIVFFGWPEDREFEVKSVWGHPIAWATSFKFKVGSVKFANYLVKILPLTPTDDHRIQFNSIQLKKNFNHPPSGNFVVVMAGSPNNKYIKLKEQYYKNTTTNKRVLL